MTHRRAQQREVLEYAILLADGKLMIFPGRDMVWTFKRRGSAVGARDYWVGKKSGHKVVRVSIRVLGKGE